MLLDCCVFFLMGPAAVAVVGIGSGLRSGSATREEIVSKDHVIQIIAVQIQELQSCCLNLRSSDQGKKK